jgi:ubiquinone/menaquinone biosynthesis C-methylase UbiE
MKPAATEWGGVADWYDQLVGEAGSEYQREVVHPGVLRLLDLKKGQRVLDVACGQGVLCRLLHEQGIEAVGVDSAAAMLHLARKRSDPAIPFYSGDARDLGAVRELAGNTFDAVACVLAIQDFDPIAPVFEGISRLLIPGGRLVLAMMHPCFRGPKQTSWGWDAKLAVQFRRVDRYLLPRREPIITHPGAAPGQHTWTFHRPIEAYVKALTRAGLLIDAMEEWVSHKVSDSGPRAPAENVARKEIPMFLALRAVKSR